MPRVLSPKTDDNQYNVRAFGAKGDGSTDDTTALNACLQKVYDDGGGTIVVPPGSYKTSAPLIIRSNTTLICDNGVTFFRSASGSLIMNGDYDEDQSVYTGHGNIRIVGGIWDMKGTTVTNGNIALAFGHGRNISIEGVTVKDVPMNHAIEINSSQTVRIRDCRFLGYYDTSGGATVHNEAIQIDLALTGGGTFGAFGLYDDTPCDDIVVQGCYFGASGTASTTAWYRGVGSHSGKAGFEHTNVRITDNHFDGLLDVAVNLFGFRRTVVADNAFDGCMSMVYANSAASQNFGNISITGNVAKDLTGNQAAITIAPDTGTASNIVVSGNAIDGVNGGTSGHGIDMSRSQYVNVTGNTIANTGGAGVRFVGTCSEVSVTNNIISATGDAGVQVTNSTNCVVSANTIANVGRNGIYSTSPTGLSLLGNTITEYGQAAGTSYGVRMSTAGSGYTISGNRIRRSGGTGTDGGGISVTGSLSGGYCLFNDVDALGVSDAGTSHSVREFIDSGSRTYTRSSDYLNSANTSYTDVLVSDPLPAGTYKVHIVFFLKSSVATTPTALIDLVAAGASSWRGMAEWWTSATARNSSGLITSVGTDVTVAPNTSERIFEYYGTLVQTSTGTLAVRLAKNGGTAANINVMTGSYMTVSVAS